MGFAPIKWTCTALFRPRHLTDRAILANRQPQEKKIGFKCFLFSVYRVYPEVEDGRGTFDLACAFAVLFGVWKPGSVLLTAEVVW